MGATDRKANPHHLHSGAIPQDLRNASQLPSVQPDSSSCAGFPAPRQWSLGAGMAMFALTLHSRNSTTQAVLHQ
jgi:hypothetical protein